MKNFTNEKRRAFHSVKHQGLAQEEEVAQVDEEDAKRKEMLQKLMRDYKVFKSFEETQKYEETNINEMIIRLIRLIA